MRARRPRSRVGASARNLIPASRLRSGATSSYSAPIRRLQGSLPLCQVVCGRDARAPGWASRPQPYSSKQPAIWGHYFVQCTNTAIAGIVAMVPGRMRARRPRSRVGASPTTLFQQAGCGPGPFLRTVHQFGDCRDRFHSARSYAGETPALPGGRPARKLIPANRLRSGWGITPSPLQTFGGSVSILLQRLGGP